MVEVILLERIENLGQMGDVVRVRPGFARNYLLPKRKALRATKDNMARFESQRAQLEAQNLKHRQEAESVGVKLDGLRIVLLRQASESGQLYGSVTARDIAEAVSEAGFTIQKGQVMLNQPIKELGVHAIRLGLHPEVSVSITANVAKSVEEAEAAVSGHSPERQEAEQAFAEATEKA
ncbi:MAG TPA: 50S ribosomal protein L9 [Alphaproteobacteria bacterium]|nr:50S ribosomal protein L9 [Alphaproteobacteria bacterium]